MPPVNPDRVMRISRDWKKLCRSGALVIVAQAEAHNDTPIDEDPRNG